jgi:hypothetical protein
MVSQAATEILSDAVSSRSNFHINWSVNQMLLQLDGPVKGRAQI